MSNAPDESSRAVAIRALADPDADAWRSLFRGYAEFYQKRVADEGLDAIWDWLRRGRLLGAVATIGGEVVGFAHWHYQPRPLATAEIAYMNDLFVAPARRGEGAGLALARHAAERARADGARLLRWATAADNTTAMRLYDRIARRTDWVLYDWDLAE